MSTKETKDSTVPKVLNGDGKRFIVEDTTEVLRTPTTPVFP